MLKGIALALCMILVGYQTPIANRGGGFTSVPTGPTFAGTPCSAAVNTTTASCSVSSVPAGAFFMACVTWYSTAAPTVFSDSNGTLVDTAIGTQLWSASTKNTDCRYIANTASGTHTITFTLAAGVLIYLAAGYWTGANTTTPIDDVEFVANTNASVGTCHSVTTTQSYDTLIVWSGQSNSVSMNPGTGFTNRISAAAQNLVSDRSVGAATTYNPTYSSTTTVSAYCVSMAIKHV